MDERELIYDWNLVDGPPPVTGRHVEFDDETLRDGIQSPSVKAPTIEEKIELLRSVSYAQFLEGIAKVSRQVVAFLGMWRGGYMGNGTDLTPAFAAMRYGLPGAAVWPLWGYHTWTPARLTHRANSTKRCFLGPLRDYSSHSMSRAA